MKTAVLYQRVSSDEQTHGHSLKDQRLRLEEYCQRQGITIAGNFIDDFTGKTFDRPGFNALLKFVKQHKTNEILFIKWTRFTRDTTDGQVMIRTLRKMGVTVQAIDEPIDFSMPVSKFMLGFYLTSGEVENDQKADFTRRGLQRAQMDGRHSNRAPYGYINKRDESRKAIIVIDQTKAPLVKKAFDLMAIGLYSQNEVRLQLKKEGMSMEKTRFALMLKNSVYCGKIKVKPYKDQPEQVVNGIHEAIVSESVFYRVQDVISGKSRGNHRKVKFNENFPLKGFLKCKHDHPMRGSISKGRKDLYAYYHCANHFHCERYSSREVNQSFVDHLTELKEAADYNKDVFSVVEFMLHPDQSEVKKNHDQIQLLEQRIKTLQDNFIDGHVSIPDYHAMRARYEGQLYELKANADKLAIEHRGLLEDLRYCKMLMEDLPTLYTEAPVEQKRDLIRSLIETVDPSGSTIRGNIIFDGKKSRTTILNPLVSLYHNTDACFSEPNKLEERSISAHVPFSSERGTQGRIIPLITGIRQLSETFKLLRA